MMPRHPEQQGMLGRRPPLRIPGRQPPGWTPFIQPPHTPPPGWPGQQPQGWPGQQPGFNLQEATGALDTAQGLLGDASSEITAADMEPLSNARGMVSQAQNALVQGFGPPRQQNPWGGRQGTMPGILGMLGGIGPQAIAGAPQGGGPQTLGSLGAGLLGGPSSSGGMLPAFMANGGPAETTGIGPLYMAGGGDAGLTFDSGDALGMAASVAANLGALGKFGAAVSPIGAALAIGSALKSGNILDVIPFNLGNVLYQRFFETDEAQRNRTAPPKWGKNRAPIKYEYLAPPWENPDAWAGPGWGPPGDPGPLGPDPTEDAAPGEGPDSGDAGFDYGGSGFDGGWMRDGGLVRQPDRDARGLASLL